MSSADAPTLAARTNGEAGTLEQVSAQETLNAITYGAYITDLKRKILFWSDAAESITGWPAEEVVGRSCSDQILVHVDGDGHGLCGGPQCPLHNTLETGEVSRPPMLLFAQHKQGHRIPVELSVAPLRNRAGERVGAVEVFRDLTRAVQELRRAKIIQDYVLHWDLPADDRVRFEVRCRPEEVVGGDFHRVQAFGPGRYAVMVADAMGHGLISALHTVHLRSAWDDCAAELPSPARFMAELNRRLHRLAGPEGYFATAVALVLDVESGKLRYTRAGHPAPLLFRRSGAAEYLADRSPAIGLLDSATYEESELKLEPDDQLLLFTDGAIELFNRQGEILGEEGFRRLVQDTRAAGQSVLKLDEVEEKLLEFAYPASLPDDVTLLSVRLVRRG